MSANWNLWKRTERQDDTSRECRHDWSNWTDPAEISVPIYSMFGGADGSSRDALVQTRVCLKCNMHERRCI